jgi:hypothetical protein
MNAIDCPDGLARCSHGSVEASRLAAVALPCRGPENACACPFEHVAVCELGCVADGVEILIDRGRAAAQLCRPDSDARSADPWSPQRATEIGTCDDGQLYRCAEGAVLDCHSHAIIAACRRGCFGEGAFIDDEVPIGREGAFAILCSR